MRAIFSNDPRFGRWVLVFRRASLLTVVLVVLLALFSEGIARAQDDDGSTEGDEELVEVLQYGDTELIEILREFDLVDEWITASPVSPQASLLRVTSGSYQAQRQVFLDSLEVWANQTEQLRSELARLDMTQMNANALRSLVNQVRDALVSDDRLRADSQTAAQIQDALEQLRALDIPEPPTALLDESPTVAEAQLLAVREQAVLALLEIQEITPGQTGGGIGDFPDFLDLQIGLDDVDRLIEQDRDSFEPAIERSERLISSTVRQIPDLHAARMLGSTDVAGLSVVTVDAYVRGAARASCAVDWALLAGIGRIESNHGRIGGASVSRNGQVSTTILGPLLDGGATEFEDEIARQVGEDLTPVVTETIRIAQKAQQVVQAVFDQLPWGLPGDVVVVEAGAGAPGNGFAVVVDTDGGRLDGNERWDRAIGPMQFIPETWSKWATDGNGDGVSDPHNLYDATATAARFLCDLSGSLGPSPSAFLLGYNFSGPYVRDVVATAQRLRAQLLPTG